MGKMHTLRDTLERELDKLADKKTMSMSDLDTVSKLLTSIKNIYKIEMYGDEYSHGGEWRADGYSYNDGYDHATRRRHYVRGHYSREGRGRDDYSRGYSMADAKQDIVADLREMMQMEGLDRDEREVLEKAMRQLSR